MLWIRSTKLSIVTNKTMIKKIKLFYKLQAVSQENENELKLSLAFDKSSKIVLKRGIRVKLLFTTLSLIFGLLITFTGIELLLQKKTAEEELQWRITTMKNNLIQQGKTLSKILDIQIESNIAAFNFSNIKVLIDNTIKESIALKYAVLTDLQGVAYVHTEKPILEQTKLDSEKDRFAISQIKSTYKEYPDIRVIEYITPINFGKPWGVLRLGFSLEGLQKEIVRSTDEMRKRTHDILVVSVIIAVIFIIIASIIVLIISTTISKPLISLTKLSQALGKGNFDAAINAYHQNNTIDIRTEIGLLATSFIEMANEIKNSHKQLEDYNRTLEEKVKQRTDELLQSEKMAALGQLIAGIAHEVNTPLGAISSSASNMRKFLTQTLTVMPSLFQSFSKQECDEFLVVLNRSLDSDTRLLSAKEQRQNRRNLARLLETEVENSDSIADTLIDMGIYDGIEDIMPLLKRPDGEEILELAYKLSELKKGTQTINTATERASKVVFALKSYAHQDDSGEKIRADIAKGVETILTLYQSQMKQGIDLIKKYDENLSEVYCYPDELNQVWTNLIHNALQAMNNKGTLVININQDSDYLKVSIQDSGKGIEPENMAKIFDAFFTTKAAGEGSGLGLHIIKKIIDKHSGKINVQSRPGCTVFNVMLPLGHE
jgi:signal transduction histidine kinase